MLGVEVLQTCEEPDVDLVFVHGLRGHAHRTWTATSSKPVAKAGLFRRSIERLSASTVQRIPQVSVFWPTDFLGPDIPNSRIMTYGYDADVSILLSKTADNNIFTIAQDLIVRLEASREGTGKGGVPIIFIAHSLGGIIVKDALKFSQEQAGFQSHLHSIYASTYGVVFFGTPHRGSSMASLGRIAARIAGLGMADSDHQLLRSLERGSPELQRIADSFSRMLPKEAKGLNVFSFQEALPISGLKMAGKVVEDESSMIGDAYEGKAALHADHMGMCRFSKKDSADYDLVSSLIRRWVRQAAKGKAVATSNITWQPDCNRTISERATEDQTNSDASAISFSKQTSSIFSLPQVPVRQFVGRDGELALIQVAFQKQSQQTLHQRIVVLHGLGGVGKTQLALTYAFGNRSQYTAVFWINARNEETILISFRDIAQNLVDWAAEHQTSSRNFTRIAHDLGLAQFVSPATGHLLLEYNKSQLIPSALKFLERGENSGWLMIFDAADDLESVNLPMYFPKVSTGEILVSSRRLQAEQLGFGIEVSCLKDTDAVRILIEAGHVEETQENRRGCESIAKVLGNLPLALGQAASYIAATGQCPRTYLEHYIAQRGNVLKQKPSKAIWQYEETVFTTWEVSFASILQRSPEAARLLQMCGYFDPKLIPYDIFRRGKNSDTRRAAIWENLGSQSKSSIVRRIDKSMLGSRHRRKHLIQPVAWLSRLIQDEETFQAAIHLLLDFSLVIENRGKDSISMHSLVHTWCQDRDRTNQRTGALDAVVVLGRAVDLELGTPEAWNLIEVLFSHVLQVTQICLDLDLGNLVERPRSLDLPHALEGLAKCLAYVGRFSEALEVFRYAYSHMSLIAGSSNPMTLFLLSQIATVLESVQQPRVAEQLWYEVIAKARRRLGVMHSDTWTYFGNLGVNLITQGRYQEANELLKKAAWKRLNLFGSENASPVFINLAVTYISLNKYDKAEEALNIAKDGQLLLTSSNLTDMLHIMGWLAFLSKEKGDRHRAEELLVSAVEMVESRYGFSNPLTLVWCQNLAEFWMEDFSAIDDALETKIRSVIDRLLAEWPKLLDQGGDHVVRIRVKFGLFLWKRGNFQAASAVLQAALETVEKQYSNRPNPKTAELLGEWLNVRGILSWDQGALEEAIPFYDRAIMLFGHQNENSWTETDLSITKNNRAVALRDIGRLEEAQQSLEHLVQEEKEEGANLINRNNLASVYHRQGKHDIALSLYTMVLAEMQELWGEAHQSTLLTKHAIACAYETIGRPEKSIEILESVLEGKEGLMGLRNPTAMKTALTLGRLYRAHGSLESAFKLAERVRPFLQYA